MRPVLGAVIVTAAIAAPQAHAASEHYFSGTLSPDRVFASTSAHSNLTYTQSVSNHTVCPGQGRGAAGLYWFGAAGTVTSYNVSYCGPGTVGYDPPDDGQFWHGTVYNPNVSTVSTVSDAHYSW